MTLIQSHTPRGLKLLMIDATLNRKGFEHEMSETIFAQLKADRIPLASDALAIAHTFSEVLAALNTDFSALLYVAHGGGPKGNHAALVQMADLDVSWYLLNQCQTRLADTFVSLCVCGGSCDDMIDTLQRGDLFAQTVVASADKLLESEAVQFFPAFYRSFLGLTESTILPDIVREKVNENNHLANGKMQAYSSGFSFAASGPNI